MIEKIIIDFFRMKASDLMPELQRLSRGQAAWEDIYQTIYGASEELIGIMRRNVDELDVNKMKRPTELNEVHLGILNVDHTPEPLQGPAIDFPTAEKL